MSETPTPEMLAKLPKWAQKHIEDLDRRAVVAERNLREYRDSQTPSDIFVEGFDDESKKIVRTYLQTNKVDVERNGVHLTVLLREYEPGIDISWYSEGRLTREVALVPKGFNSISIIGKEQMR